MSDEYSEAYKMVEEFHNSFGHPIRVKPTQRELEFRLNLITEEYWEARKEIQYEDDTQTEVDLTKLTKELADLLYVIYGTAVSAGLPLDQAFHEVHRSNMSKLGEDGKPIYREDKKVLKGPNYSEANIKQFFE